MAVVTWAFALVLLIAWLVWFVRGNVAVYEVSRSARLEVQQSAYPVAALASGKVVGSRMVLGQEVHAGDVLVTLDLSREQLRLAEERTKLASFEPKIASLGREILALKRALAEDHAAAEAAISAARSRAREASTSADFAKENERRLREESKAGGVAQVEALRAAAEAQRLSSTREAMESDAVRIDNDARTRRSQQEAQIESLDRTIVTLEGDKKTTQSTIERLTQELEQFVVRAPVDGVIGEITPLQFGAYLQVGQKLATVVPRGGMVVVAEFPPAAVLGRMHPGQRGNLRLDGFPWTEFGSMDVEVRQVASEIREQKIRVEFALLPATNSKILMQHGLPGTVEVRIQQTSPAVLLLRTIGQMSAGSVEALNEQGATKL